MKNELVIAFMEHRPISPVGATVKPDMLTAVQDEIKRLQILSGKLDKERDALISRYGDNWYDGFLYAQKLQAECDLKRTVDDESECDCFHPESISEKYTSTDVLQMSEDAESERAETQADTLASALANRHFDKGVNACITELTQCYEVALRENGNIDDANSIEVLIDHLQQLRKQQD